MQLALKDRAHIQNYHWYQFKIMNFFHIIMYHNLKQKWGVEMQLELRKELIFKTAISIIKIVSYCF